MNDKELKQQAYKMLSTLQILTMFIGKENEKLDTLVKECEEAGWAEGLYEKEKLPKVDTCEVCKDMNRNTELCEYCGGWFCNTCIDPCTEAL